jgi:hypothetical protein
MLHASADAWTRGDLGGYSTMGRYILYDRSTDAETATGLFSLLLERTSTGWTIVHDHSSADGSG